jgi:sugar lactone lactonase YvrE
MKRYRIPVLWFALLILLSGCSGNSSQNSSSQMGGAIQGTSVLLAPVVSTFAGVSPGAVDGIGTAARFNSPNGITTDGTSLFVVDQRNRTIRRIDIATRTVTTLAGSVDSSGLADGVGPAAGFLGPSALTTDGTNLYVTDATAIRKVVIATGEVTTIAGSATTSGAANGVGSDARFNSPMAITTDGANLYVADSGNYAIRKITIATADVTTLAVSTGYTGTTGTTGGTGTAAGFGWVVGMVTDGSNLFIADNSSGTIRKIVIATGEVSAVAVSSSAAEPVWIVSPSGMATDGTSLFITDQADRTIKKLEIATGMLSAVAGNAGSYGASDGIGAAATFNNPAGITTDGTNLFVTDSVDGTVRRIVAATGEVSTLAGTASQGSSDGQGNVARFYSPLAVTTDGTNLYVTDSSNFTIRKVSIASGAVTTLAGTVRGYGAADGTGTAASFGLLGGITTDGTSLYVTDYSYHTIRKIVIATGVVSTLAGSAGTSGSSDGTGAAASFTGPHGITTDGTNLFVADSGNHTIRRVVIATGAVSTLAGTAGTSGASDGTGGAALFKSPYGLTTDGTNLFIADTGNNKIRKLVIATGAVTTVADTAVISIQPINTSPNGSLANAITATPIITPIIRHTPVVTATTGIIAPPPTPQPPPIGIPVPHTPLPQLQLFSRNAPLGIATDGTNLFITLPYRVRRLEIATGVMTDIAGGYFRSGSKDGAGTVATFGGLRGITTDGKSLYVTDSGNNSIRRIQ